MKKLLLIAILFAGISSLEAQTEFMDRGGKTALTKGSFQINAGSGYTTWGVPIYAGVDYAFNEDITLGGFVSYSQFSEDWGTHKWNHSVLSVFASGNMHVNRLLQFNDNVDLYGGLSLGFNNYDTKSEGDVPQGTKYGGRLESGMLYGIQAGARYYFTESLGVNGEVIVGNLTGIHAGLTYRIY